MVKMVRYDVIAVGHWRGDGYTTERVECKDGLYVLYESVEGILKEDKWGEMNRYEGDMMEKRVVDRLWR